MRQTTCTGGTSARTYQIHTRDVVRLATETKGTAYKEDKQRNKSKPK